MVNKLFINAKPFSFVIIVVTFIITFNVTKQTFSGTKMNYSIKCIKVQIIKLNQKEIQR